MKIAFNTKMFSDYGEKLEAVGGNLKRATEEALEKSKDYVNGELHKQMKKHNRSHKTDKSIQDNAKVVWSGFKAEINVGFDIKHGGMASIFLMHGTPRANKDQKLYNAVYGTATKKKITEIQQKVFEKAIKEAMK